MTSPHPNPLPQAGEGGASGASASLFAAGKGGARGARASLFAAGKGGARGARASLFAAGEGGQSAPFDSRSIEARALALVGDARVVGLGTGRAAERFIRALAANHRDVVCVATSEHSAALASGLGLRLVPLQPIDVTFDGADEVDPALNLIKGYGGALLREKIVARYSARCVYLVGEEKLVPALGSRGRLPLEVLPFAVRAVSEKLAIYAPVLRRKEDGTVFVTDNANHIVDVTPPVPLTLAFEAECKAVAGVIETGCFFALATTVLVERPNAVEELQATLENQES